MAKRKANGSPARPGLTDLSGKDPFQRFERLSRFYQQELEWFARLVIRPDRDDFFIRDSDDRPDLASHAHQIIRETLAFEELARQFAPIIVRAEGGSALIADYVLHKQPIKRPESENFFRSRYIDATAHEVAAHALWILAAHAMRQLNVLIDFAPATDGVKDESEIGDWGSVFSDLRGRYDDWLRVLIEHPFDLDETQRLVARMKRELIILASALDRTIDTAEHELKSGNEVLGPLSEPMTIKEIKANLGWKMGEKKLSEALENQRVPNIRIGERGGFRVPISMFKHTTNGHKRP